MSGAAQGLEVTGTMHWVTAAHAADVANPNSLEVLTGGKLEPALAAAEPESRAQFERDDAPACSASNRTVGLRDTLVRIEKSGA